MLGAASNLLWSSTAQKPCVPDVTMAVMQLSGVHSNLLLSCPRRVCAGSMPTDPQVLPQGGGSSGSLGKEGTEDACDTLMALPALESVTGTKKTKNK